MEIEYYTFVRLNETLIAEIELKLYVEYDYQSGEDPSAYSPGEAESIDPTSVIVDDVTVHSVFSNTGEPFEDQASIDQFTEMIKTNFNGKKVQELPLTDDNGIPLNYQKDIEPRLINKIKSDLEDNDGDYDDSDDSDRNPNY